MSRSLFAVCLLLAVFAAAAEARGKCTTDDHCNGKTCDVTTGRCICTSDDQCGANKACYEGRCKDSCTSTAQCEDSGSSEQTKACDTNAGVCRHSCTADTDCKYDLCDPDNFCGKKACTLGGTECSTGYTCVNEICKREKGGRSGARQGGSSHPDRCPNGDECDEDENCYEGRCLDSCTISAECDSSSEVLTCDTANSVCRRGCTDPGECGRRGDCVNQFCVKQVGRRGRGRAGGRRGGN